MKFGISFLPDAEPKTKSASDYYSDAITLCKIADQGGLNTVKMTEHYLHPYGGYCPSPLNFLSAVASCTKQIRLMTGCILPVFHHPLQIAAETAMVDVISNGRLDVGFARAYLPYEFAAFNIDMDESRDRYINTIQTVQKLWTESSVSVETPYFSFENAVSMPQPIQNPHPPIWGAAVNSRQSFAWLGEQGHNLLITPPPGPLENLCELIDIYRESFFANKENHDKLPNIAISMIMYLTEDEKIAQLEASYYIQQYFNVWADAADAWSKHSSLDYPGYTGMSKMLRNNQPNTMITQNQVVVGDPQHACETILAIKELLKIDQILWQIEFGAQSLNTSKRTLELFLEKVLPNIK